MVTTQKVRKDRSYTPEGETRRYVCSEHRENAPVTEKRDLANITPDKIQSEEEYVSINTVSTQSEQGHTSQQDYEPVVPLMCQQSVDMSVGFVDNHKTKRSTQDRKSAQMFTYESLGQPSYQLSYQYPHRCQHIGNLGTSNTTNIENRDQSCSF